MCARMRRYTLRLSVGSVLSAADLAWLEGAFSSCGLLQRTASLDLACVDADLTGALQSVRAALLLTRKRATGNTIACMRVQQACPATLHEPSVE